MSSPVSLIVITALVVVFGAAFFILRGEQFALPEGETEPLTESAAAPADKEAAERTTPTLPVSEEEEAEGAVRAGDAPQPLPASTRTVFVTDGVKHSIALDEILSGGPPKDGIPSIDNPVFISAKEAGAFLNDESVGLGITYKGEVRFYPYQILVWHEIVNDTFAGDPVLVTYCPLCATGIAFEGVIDGKPAEFGVSGRLWRSNLLMYNRSADPDDESLWSQVLGEAVLGVHTGTRLALVPSDTVRFGDWVRVHPDTRALSRDTGTRRDYGRDPYGNYYTSDSVSFGATFSDTRLHPKEFVLGVEIDGQYKAYQETALSTGSTRDTFAGQSIVIEKSDIGTVRMYTEVDEERAPLPYIGGFWFSWLAAHPETELFSK